jgi:L-alanine-DL-glutamate epimerase-like enolase superfamily enzyme
VDANGRFNLEIAMAYARALTPYGLRWYEEAGDPLDYELQAKLSHVHSPPMATGENLFSVQDARNLIRYAMRDCGRIATFCSSTAYLAMAS